MAKFCGKCGSPTIPENGLCPNCDCDRLTAFVGENDPSMSFEGAQPVGSAAPNGYAPLQGYTAPNGYAAPAGYAAPVQRVQKTKKQKSKALSVLLTVFLSFLLFMFLFPAIFIFDVRSAMSKNSLENMIENVRASDILEQAYASDDADADGFFAHLEEEYGIELTERKLNRLLEKSAFKEYFADEMADAFEALLEGEGEIEITKREFTRMLQKDADLIEKEFDVELSRYDVQEIADMVFDEEEYVFDVGEMVDELERPGFSSIPFGAGYIYRTITRLFSNVTMGIFLAICLLIVLLMLKNSPSQAAVGIGVVLIVWGAFFGILALASFWFASVVKGFIFDAFVASLAEALMGGFISVGAKTGVVLLVVGILILVVRSIVKKHCAKKQATAA